MLVGILHVGSNSNVEIKGIIKDLDILRRLSQINYISQ